MKIAILGNGKEGQAVKKYFEQRGDECEVFDDFTDADIKGFDLERYDEVFRSPSVRPRKGWNSVTKYFFEKCPCPIIGVTGTKGKGTTCSLIESILKALGKKVWLVGNIGVPAIEVLDEIKEDDVVVYELSSFQLWDLKTSPGVAVVLPIEPDHLNIHKDFDEYVAAKAKIARYQEMGDTCIYNYENEWSEGIADGSAGQTVPYPVAENDKLIEIPGRGRDGKLKPLVVTDIYELLERALDSLTIVGQHNRENAQAALLAVCAYLRVELSDLLKTQFDVICKGLSKFKGLSHRLEFIRELKGVKYYDDNFSTNVASTRVAIDAFPNNSVVLIVGGRDKTNGKSLPEIYQELKKPNVKRVVLIGEVGRALAEKYPDEEWVVVKTLKQAVRKAKSLTGKLERPVILMSPAAASFDMFSSVYDRGEQYQKIVKALK